MSASGESGSGSDTSCFDQYNRVVYVAVAAARAGVGAFSAVCCLVVILLIFLYKKHQDFTQRLVLNLAIAALVHSISYPLSRVNFYSNLQLFDPYCYFGGFLNLYSSWIEVLALMWIVYHLFVGGVLDRATHRFELLFWLATYILPLLWCWIPFIHHSYSTSGAWCAIRSQNADCSRFTFGEVLQFALWYLPLHLLLLFTFIVSVSVAVKVHRDTRHWSGVHDKVTRAKREKIKTEIRPLIWFPVIYLILNTFSFVDRIYNVVSPDDPLVVLTYLHVFSSPLRGAFVALVYTLGDRTTLQRLRWRQLKANCYECCYSYRAVQEYPAITDDHSDSFSSPYEKDDS